MSCPTNDPLINFLCFALTKIDDSYKSKKDKEMVPETVSGTRFVCSLKKAAAPSFSCPCSLKEAAPLPFPVRAA